MKNIVLLFIMLMTVVVAQGYTFEEKTKVKKMAKMELSDLSEFFSWKNKNKQCVFHCKIYKKSLSSMSIATGIVVSETKRTDGYAVFSPDYSNEDFNEKDVKDAICFIRIQKPSVLANKLNKECSKKDFVDCYIKVERESFPNDVYIIINLDRTVIKKEKNWCWLRDMVLTEDYNNILGRKETSTISSTPKQEETIELNPFDKSKAKSVADMNTADVVSTADAFIKTKADALKCIENLHQIIRMYNEVYSLQRKASNVAKELNDAHNNVIDKYNILLFSIIKAHNLNYTKTLPPQLFKAYLEWERKNNE